MANKIITLDSRFATGEPTVQLIATPGRDGRMLRERTSLHMSKTASQSPAMDYIRNVEPQPGKSIVLIIGLGDHETYGPNRNADGFPSEPVPGKITSDQVLTKHYKSYENANVFEHHVNHDPAKAIGKVLKAFWNHIMRRVEVLEDFDHEKAPHLLQRVGDGEFPSKSMGCGPAGTPVMTSTGSCPIEKLVVGDMVITHRGRPRAITELHVRPYAGDLCTVITAASSSTMTADHPYAVPSPDGTHEHWVPAQELRPGMQVLTQAGYVPVLTVLRSAFVGEVYNFEVEEDHTYVVNGHAVHNCKIPYDVCTVCGNKAPTRKQYCDHLKYEMGKIYPDGVQSCALNPSPKFFDSSWVIRPADRTGYMLKKVAYDEISLPSYELSDRIYELRGKSAALGKAADMEKVISGEPAGTSTRTDKGTLKLLKSYNDTVAPSEASKLPSSDVRITIEYTPEQAVGTSDAMGLPMGLRDLVQYFMGRMGAEGEPSDEDLDCACKHAEALMETFAAYPRFYEDALKLAGLSTVSVNDKLANALGAPQAQMPNERVRTPRWLPEPFASDTPNTDVLTFTDHTGVTHRTNMGQVRETNQALKGRAQGEKYVRGAGHLGLGAVLGTAGLGAIMTGGRSPIRRGLGALAVAGGVASGAKGIHEAVRPVRMGDLDGPKILTNEGQTISGLTQMKSGSAWAPEMVYSVLRQRDKVASTPGISLLAAVKQAEVYDDLSPLLGPTLDVAKVARIVEDSITRTP